MHDELRDSPIFRMILQEGREQGRKEGRKQGRLEGQVEGQRQLSARQW